MKKRLHLEHWQVIALYLMIYDGIAIAFSYFFGLLLRFDFSFSKIETQYLYAYYKFIPFYIVVAIVIFYLFHLYNSMWRFASFDELSSIIKSWIVTTLIHIVGITIFVLRMPLFYYFVGSIMQLFLVTAIRFSYRYINMIRKKNVNKVTDKHNTMIIGAGESGRMIARELAMASESDLTVCCFIDDNSNKWGRYIEGTPIVGGRDTIFGNVKKYKIDTILFAIPSAKTTDKRDILNICVETGCNVQSLPSIYQLATDQGVSMKQMKTVNVEDLLGRDEIKVDNSAIFSILKSKVILVTGVGSIGGELCRQIAAHSCEHLILFDVYENNVYEIEQELKRKYPNLKMTTLIGSVRDSRRLEMVFKTYRPNIVFHAAAHKHVPLMETSPNEAIKNNAIGTYKTAYYAMEYGVERFLLISTDKAVNPTNVMGASKRICEMIIQTMNVISASNQFDKLPILHEHVDKDINNEKIQTKTQFIAVRFGNVLGSHGSVIPLFKKQIEDGGPVTVTHPDIVRYFMTIPEAVRLILQAVVYAKGGEIFVLDMGEPVKIDTLAKNLIHLMGYTPNKDIQIVYTGLRPGEKMYEEKLMAEEGMKKTENDLIFIGHPIDFDTEYFLEQLQELAELSYNNDEHIVEKVKEIVTTFK